MFRINEKEKWVFRNVVCYVARMKSDYIDVLYISFQRLRHEILMVNC